MIKKINIKFLRFHMPPIFKRFAVILGIFGFLIATQLSSNTYNKPLPQEIITKSTAQAAASPKKVKIVAPTPPAAKVTPPTPAAVVVPKAVTPAAKPTEAIAPKPTPVVVPSPQSNVSGLTPTSPNSSSSPSGSGGSGSSSSGSGSGGSPPATTTSYSSTNWSGYLATDGSFTSISGSWAATRPTAQGYQNSADATWIGIGGVSTSDLIQIGTQNTVSPSGVVSSAAFYELLPSDSQTVPGVTVSPGDSMSATINLLSGTEWSMTITDNTNGQSYTSNVSYDSSQSSAEWIEEDPSYTNNRQVPFDNFGTATFTGGLTTENGSNQSIYNAGGDPITMLNHSNQTVASTSALNSGGNGFTVSREGAN